MKLKEWGFLRYRPRKRGRRNTASGNQEEDDDLSDSASDRSETVVETGTTAQGKGTADEASVQPPPRLINDTMSSLQIDAPT